MSLLLTGSGLMSCDKQDSGQPTPTPAPTPETAVLSGKIQPAEAVTAVTATDKSGKAVSVSPNSAGEYALPAAALGEYILRFTTTSSYAEPAAYTATLRRGGTFVATTAELAPASATIEVDGVRVTRKITVEHMWFSTIGDDAYTFYLANSSYLGNQYPMVCLGLHYACDYETGPEVNITLPLGDQCYTARYEEDFMPPLYAGDWYPSRTGGTLTTTSVNKTKHLFSGTFEFKAGNYLDGEKREKYALKTIKGTFTNLPYEVSRR
ncbi:hypothetical protein GCM10027175_09970 [Hymenobacter latericoloratus]